MSTDPVAAVPWPVFLIDDDEVVLRACVQTLKLADIRVRSFPGAEQALAALEEEPAAVIVSDVRLGGMSGLELLDVVHRHDAAIPVILITGHGDVTMAVQAMRAHAYDFIEKPFNDQILLDGVHHALAVDATRRRARAQYQELLRRFDTLTAREQDVLRWVVAGLSNREIAETLSLSRKTVEIHRARVMRKMEADTLSQLIQMTVAIGILKLYDPDA